MSEEEIVGVHSIPMADRKRSASGILRTSSQHTPITDAVAAAPYIVEEEVVKEFFTVAPSGLVQPEDTLDRVTQFVHDHVARGNRVVIITSGGTTVPLEKNTVRFLDNFSGGGRGSASVEYFIESGYAVIFLHRKNSLQPYQRHFMLLKDDQFLDYLQWDDNINSIKVQSDNQKIKTMLQRYHKAKSEHKLLKISFSTIHEYLYLLKEVSERIRVAKSAGLVYVAAAVSDFYLPSAKMVEHKIQSIKGPLDLTLDPVPKMLGALKHHWVPRAFVVSFKLETDYSILHYKATQSLERYGHHLVIGNLLQNYRNEVFLYDDAKSSEPTSRMTRSEEEMKSNADLEKEIIDQVVSRHTLHIELNQ
ncbi:putative phosphopantothenoylcysteine synthetase [Planoprotostelium fungivorum]|uniref:Putative phosphopantothenoylcysteine synthetase n=1 Tax=Planoprotostelium fungivorum TaxID=1890364 RepID=A0A2P6NYN9_9EUKA|nr:putative phosphopantothenoylcysteine synthetase [Planoprotostelium fungivorum]